MPARTLVVLNPKSRRGRARRRWALVEAQLRTEFGAEFEIAETRAPRDAERIAREGVRAGVERLVVVGGDGTTSEVVTGLLAANLGEYAELALLRFGTGGDMARALGVPREPEEAIRRLVTGKTRRVDAGRLTYVDRRGREAQTYFLNVAGFGLSGLVSNLVNQAPKVLGGTASFLIGALRGIARYRSPEVSVRVDDVPVYDGRLVLGVAANGCYFGGGMKIAPEARPDDGLLEMVFVEDVSKARLLANLPRIYRGTHLRHPNVRYLRGRKLEAVAPPGVVWLDVDGEVPGTLPATIEILPGAITLIGADG